MGRQVKRSSQFYRKKKKIKLSHFKIASYFYITLNIRDSIYKILKERKFKIRIVYMYKFFTNNNFRVQNWKDIILLIPFLATNKGQIEWIKKFGEKIEGDWIYLTIPLKLGQMWVRVAHILQLKNWKEKRERNQKKE